MASVTPPPPCFTVGTMHVETIYLSNRKIMVYFNGSYSDIINVKYGVHYGSCLGPLHHSIYTNDLSLVLNKAHISMYADDSTIYLAAAIVDHLNANPDRDMTKTKINN